MALEDAAVLGSLLSRLEHIEQLGEFLKAYEGLRYVVRARSLYS